MGNNKMRDKWAKKRMRRRQRKRRKMKKGSTNIWPVAPGKYAFTSVKFIICSRVQVRRRSSNSISSHAASKDRCQRAYLTSSGIGHVASLQSYSFDFQELIKLLYTAFILPKTRHINK